MNCSNVYYFVPKQYIFVPNNKYIFRNQTDEPWSVEDNQNRPVSCRGLSRFRETRASSMRDQVVEQCCPSNTHRCDTESPVQNSATCRSESVVPSETSQSGRLQRLVLTRATWRLGSHAAFNGRLLFSTLRTRELGDSAK